MLWFAWHVRKLKRGERRRDLPGQPAAARAVCVHDAKPGTTGWAGYGHTPARLFRQKSEKGRRGCSLAGTEHHIPVGISPCAKPQVAIDGARGTAVVLELDCWERRRCLPVIWVGRAA
jgi:hypothetical protein